MSVRQERAARRARMAEQKAQTIIAGAVARVSPPASPQDQAAEVKRLRDQGMAWWVIGQKLGLAQPAQVASEPEAKRGASKARSLYAAANRGEVPRTHAPRKGTTAKPQGPGRSGTVTARKQQLVDDGHVIPRDLDDGEVEEMLKGRTIEWAIDLARLTNTDPTTWGPEDQRWMKQEARIHEDWCRVGEEDNDGNRIVRFREYLGRDNNGRLMSGPTRTIRVDSIYTIR